MKRRFENTGDGRYWELGVQGSWLVTSTGTIGVSRDGADSQMFASAEEVEAETSRRIEEKLSSGYEEVAEPREASFEASLLWRLAAERSESALPPLEDRTGDEWAAWAAIRKEADLSGWAERLIFSHPHDPDTIKFSELSATMTSNVHGTALVCAAFSNLQFLCAWDNDDERTYLVARSATKGNYHRVYWFVARFLELDDRSWPSITSFLWRDREDAEALPAMTPPYLDPITLSRRSTWLTCALAGVGTGSIEEDTKNIADVASFSEEAELLAEHAHLACYWLLHHYIAGNTSMLQTAIENTKASSHPWVAQLRGLLTRASQAARFRIGAIADDYLASFAKAAPARAFAIVSSGPEESISAAPLQVQHAKFGEGRVVELLGTGENAKVVVDFDTVGRKTILQRFLRGL